MALGLSRLTTCGIFPDQGLNHRNCPLLASLTRNHWTAREGRLILFKISSSSLDQEENYHAHCNDRQTEVCWGRACAKSSAGSFVRQSPPAYLLSCPQSSLSLWGTNHFSSWAPAEGWCILASEGKDRGLALPRNLPGPLPLPCCLIPGRDPWAPAGASVSTVPEAGSPRSSWGTFRFSQGPSPNLADGCLLAASSHGLSSVPVHPHLSLPLLIRTSRVYDLI